MTERTGTRLLDREQHGTAGKLCIGRLQIFLTRVEPEPRSN